MRGAASKASRAAPAASTRETGPRRRSQAACPPSPPPQPRPSVLPSTGGGSHGLAFLPRTGHRLTGASVKGLVGPRWCWVPAMVQGFGPMAHRRVFTAPFVTPGRREQWICCGVSDVALAKILDHLVSGRLSPTGPHGPPSAHRRRGPGLSPGGGRAAGSLPPPGCCSSKRSFASGCCKLFVSSAPVRQLAPRARPARAPSQPCTSRTQPAHSPTSPRACV